jgi:hypothetical protein
MNDQDLIHERYKSILTEANEEPRYNNSMNDKKIYPNREEAINAIRQFMDRLYELEEMYGVSLAENDPSAGSYYTARYYNEKGEVKTYYHD